MKALDKIIVVQYEDGELSEHWCKENRTDNISVEYIRKDALLEWAKEKFSEAESKARGYSIGVSTGKYLAYMEVIDKLNEI